MNIERIEDDYLAVSVDNEIDEICDQFERELAAGRRPQIDEYVERASAARRAQLYGELAAINGDYRQWFFAEENFAGPEIDLSADTARQRETLDAGSSGEILIDAAPAGEVIAHYELIEKVGAGGFGTVWKARDTRLDRPVAIKVSRIYPGHDAECERFLREAQIAAQLNHPGIINVHEAGRTSEVFYIVSKFLDGVVLDRWVAAGSMSTGPRSPADIATLCSKLAVAVDYAHRNGVIHRDLKPANIIVDAAGEPHITDFGTAKRLTPGVTHTHQGQLMGTPAYMSPELAALRPNEADRRSDVYSLGVILYQLLTGKTPFEGGLDNVLYQIVHNEPRAPREINSLVPQDLETICLKAMEKQPADRYATAQELADDLQRFLQGEPVHARPYPFWQRAWQRFKRNSVSAPGAAFLALLIPAVGVLSWSSARRQPVAPVAAPVRATRITTEPAGARLAIVPIDENTGLPDADKVIRPKGKTPLVVDLGPADYLVVADIPGYGFNEVYRRVPGIDETDPEMQTGTRYSRESRDGKIDFATIHVIRESEATSGLVRLSGGHFVMGDRRWPTMQPHECEVDDYFLAPAEVTVGEFRRVCHELPSAFTEAGLPEDDDLPMTFVTFREALDYAEAIGRRLPTEAEYEYAATAGGTRDFPWGDDDTLITEWEYGAVGSVTYDITITNPPIFGLYSNVAEWADSRPLPYPSPLQPPLPPMVYKMFKQGRVVRGGQFVVIPEALKETEWRRGPRWRQGENPEMRHRGLGFRCARSAKPRFLE